MNRRALLGTLGSAGVAALTGCLADGADGGTPSETDTAGDAPTSTPTMTDAEFTVRDSRNGTQTDSATVAVDGQTVVVTGSIWGHDGCQTAELAGTSYDGAADELTVAVATTERADAGDACTEAIVEIDYEASVTFEHGTPGTVVVTHSRGSDTETVTTVSP